MNLNLFEVDVFLDSLSGRMIIIQDFMLHCVQILFNLSYVDITLLAELDRYFSWLFTHIMGHGLTLSVPKLFIYIL